MSSKHISILLADDDSDDCNFFKKALAELPLSTSLTILHDGEQLMSYLFTYSDDLPDILFLDLNMPRKSGIECLQEIRNIQRLKDLSVAIYSTSASEQDIEETFVRGANVYIKKPSEFSTLKKILSEVISINIHYHTWGLNKENFLLNI